MNILKMDDLRKFMTRHCSLLADAGAGTGGSGTGHASFYGECTPAALAERRAAWRRAGVDCRFSVRGGGDFKGLSGKLRHDDQSASSLPESRYWRDGFGLRVKCLKAGKNVLFSEAQVFDEREALVCSASSQLLVIPWQESLEETGHVRVGTRHRQIVWAG